MKVLHITPHVGGGIGSAYAGITQYTPDIQHDILLLEKPIKTEFVERMQENRCNVYTLDTVDWRTKIKEADIMQINWWHHPGMCRFLHEFPAYPVRPVVWVHVSGCSYPYIRADFLNRFSQCMFTTPYSFDNPEVKAHVELMEKSRVVYGMADMDGIQKPEHDKEKGESLCVGYVGTINPCKLHPQIINFYAQAPSDCDFLMVGDEQYKSKLMVLADQVRPKINLEFTGFVSDIAYQLSRMDVFSYILNPAHYGATENALLEAMAFGLPVVALKQCVEQYIIKDGETGLLVTCPEEYGNALRWIRENPKKARQLGKNARAYVSAKYVQKNNLDLLYKTYINAMQTEKYVFDIKDLFGKEPWQWFLYMVEYEKKYFLSNQPWKTGPIFWERSKSSVHHFWSYFPYDVKLRGWLNAMNEKGEACHETNGFHLHTRI